MNNKKQKINKIKVLSDKIQTVHSKILATGSAAALIERLVYSTKLANDHVLHELEARYGAVVAQYIMEKMPK